jgi:hypothetical protein
MIENFTKFDNKRKNATLISGMITWQDYKRPSYRENLAGRCVIDKDFDSSFPQM